ncbi:MAG: glycosyltransferase family 2 protein [Nanoarchaeota archaeon]|nr:glycosyltransferase family 2 protein [Nanoarchaeota archaeon]
MKDVTVVIPTYNRRELIRKTLLSLEKQTYPKDKFEVIVVDDGSTDDTEKIISKLKKGLKLDLSYFKQNNKGPASARNVGIKHARKEYIYFVDDDIELSPICLEERMKTHAKEDIAVLGYTVWSDKIKVTEFMNFIAPNGFLFNYANIKDPNDCGYGCFWTNNISLHRHWLKEDIFDETFYPEKGKPIMEDAELAYRLSKKGLRIMLNKKALSYHYHILEEKKFFERGKLAGQTEVLFYKKHGFDKKLEKYKKIVPLLCLVSKTLLLINPFFKMINKEKYWKFNMLKSRFDGINKGLKLYI